MKNRWKFVLGGTIITIVIAILFIVYFSNKDELIKEFCLGIIISIISSLMFFLCSEFLFNDDTIKSEVHDIKGYCELTNELNILGIQNIKSISVDDQDTSFWLSILKNSHEQLDIIAHTLSPWFKDDYQDSFINKIVELANNNKIVRILILDPNGNNLNFVNTGDLGKYREKIFNTVKSIKGIYDKINPNSRKNLIIKFNSSYVIPYSYIRNDVNTFVSPYLCSNSERSSFITVCSKGKKIANVFNNDFEDIFKNTKMQVLAKTVLVNSVHSKSNEYSSRDWNREDTYRYVFKVDDILVEAGYYVHFKDNSIVDKTIELSTSCGCVCKCKYCASSQIPSFTPLSAHQMMDIFETICQLNDVSDNEDNLIIAMTGTGDYRYTYKNTNDFMLAIHKKNIKAEFIISSCAWGTNMLNSAEEVSNSGVSLRFLQYTYLSHDRNIIESIIPYFPHDCNIDQLGIVVNRSKLADKLRINYLMIKDINDDDNSFNEFFRIIDPIKENVLVRISKLNQTSCSVKNKLSQPSDKNLYRLNDWCKNKGISSYIFKSHQNDNMNCGQLITDKQ